MSAADWIAIAGVSLPVAAVGLRMVIGMTRLVDAVERLTKSLETVAITVQDHERRIVLLERYRPRHRAG